MSSSFNTAIKSVTWILAVIAVGTVAFRLYLRRKFNVTCTAEEWLMVAAVIFHIVFQACVTLQCDYGLGLPLQAMSMDQIIQLSKWIWISATFSNIASVLARISITVMLVRIFGTRKWFKMLMISFTTIQGVLAVVNVICIWAQATPVEGLWDQRVRQSIWNPMIQQVIATILQGLFAISDLLFALFPVMFIWKLNMPLHRKVSLIILMAMSVITMCAALGKIVINGIFWDVGTTNPDIFAAFAAIILCTTIEQALVIIIGCAPTLRPIAKLDFSWVRSVSDSLTSLITTRRRKQEPESLYIKHRQSHSYEMQPRLGSSDEEQVLGATKADRSVTMTEIPSRSSGIRRTDDFSVSYGIQAKPNETV